MFDCVGQLKFSNGGCQLWYYNVKKKCIIRVILNKFRNREHFIVHKLMQNIINK